MANAPFDPSKIFVNELGHLVVEDHAVSEAIANALKAVPSGLNGITTDFALLKDKGCGNGADPPIRSLCHCYDLELHLHME